MIPRMLYNTSLYWNCEMAVHSEQCSPIFDLPFIFRWSPCSIRSRRKNPTRGNPDRAGLGLHRAIYKSIRSFDLLDVWVYPFLMISVSMHINNERWILNGLMTRKGKQDKQLFHLFTLQFVIYIHEGCESIEDNGRVIVNVISFHLSIQLSQPLSYWHFFVTFQIIQLECFFAASNWMSYKTVRVERVGLKFSLVGTI